MSRSILHFKWLLLLLCEKQTLEVSAADKPR